MKRQNYEVMFNDILKIDTDPRLRQEITRDINWARKTLRKNDRIIWFLRWSKIWYQLSGGIWAGGRANTSLSGALQQYNQRFQTRYVAGDLRSPPVMKTQLEHFLGLPVPEIQNYVFRTESPRQLFELFTKYEAVWRQRIEEEKSLITPEPEDEILISFADGYAWWLLPRGGCPVEAEAMGHCGNVPSQRPGDQILSLRRQVRLDLRSRAEGSTRGDVIRWYPVATFILDDDGQLGEMKGRGNDKPAAKYHPYIVELLTASPDQRDQGRRLYAGKQFLDVRPRSADPRAIDCRQARTEGPARLLRRGGNDRTGSGHARNQSARTRPPRLRAFRSGEAGFHTFDLSRSRAVRQHQWRRHPGATARIARAGTRTRIPMRFL